MKIAVVEARDDYCELLDTIDSEAETLEQAISEVDLAGYRVMPDAEGGDCHRFGRTEEEDSWTVTVYPPEII